MKLPSLMPDNLNYTSAASNARALYEMLQQNPDDFSRFIQSAAIDETWCLKHHAFMKLSLQWFTNQFFEDRLQIGYAKIVAGAIRKHYHVLGKWTPKNLNIEISNKKSYPISCLLMGTTSEWLRQKIRQDCRDQHSNVLSFNDLTLNIFLILEEYIEKGNVHALWSKSQEELLSILEHASEWHLTELSEECQQLQKKYIDDANVVQILIKSHEEGWHILRKSGMGFINRSDVGVRLEDSAVDQFSIEFLDFRKPALNFYESIRSIITHLTFKNRLTEDQKFTEVVHRCPKLQTICVSETNVFSDRLLDLPSNLEGLDLSKCSWLTIKNLKQLLENSPSLSSLSLGSNTQLNYTAWGLLKLLKSLEKLDITSCHQVNDQDLKVILQAGRGLTHLNLSRCTGLSDLSFFELAKYARSLVDLNLSKCSVYDAALIEIVTKCTKLTHLNLCGCATLSDRGVFEAVRFAPNLRSVDLTGCNISQKTILQLGKSRASCLIIHI